MNINGEKIVLRAVEPEDNDVLLEILNNPEAEKNLGGYSYPASKVSQQKWLDSLNSTYTTIRCIFADKSDLSKVLGTVIRSDINRKDGNVEIYIKLSSEGHGKGYGIDAIRAVVTYAFAEQRLNCVFAKVLDYNDASKRLFEKFGFSQEGLLRQRVYKNNRYVDVVNYSILDSELEEIRGISSDRIITFLFIAGCFVQFGGAA